MIKKNKNSRPLFIGEIESYTKLFKEGVLSKKSGLLTEALCCICYIIYSINKNNVLCF